ncbi:MAG: hypothetical protein ACI8UO_005393 [Verrucomicrobiales bacterium]|jgi:hypothetical protein
MSEEDIFELLKLTIEDCGREVPDREIRDAVRNSKETAWGKSKDCPGAQKKMWPQANEERIRQVTLKHGLDQVELKARSPHSTWMKRRRLRTEFVLDSLFPKDSWICSSEEHGGFRYSSSE